MKKITLIFIRLYQLVISNGILKTIFLGGGCRFNPTCSEYTYQAVKSYGTIKGLFLGLLQISHCHPFSKHV